MKGTRDGIPTRPITLEPPKTKMDLPLPNVSPPFSNGEGKPNPVSSYSATAAVFNAVGIVAASSSVMLSGSFAVVLGPLGTRANCCNPPSSSEVVLEVQETLVVSDC